MSGFHTGTLPGGTQQQKQEWNHQPFADYTSRKPYLLYQHLWSTEIGD